MPPLLPSAACAPLSTGDRRPSTMGTTVIGFPSPVSRPQTAPALRPLPVALRLPPTHHSSLIIHHFQRVLPPYPCPLALVPTPHLRTPSGLWMMFLSK